MSALRNGQFREIPPHNPAHSPGPIQKCAFGPWRGHFPCHQGKMQGTSFADAGPAILSLRNPNPPKDFHPGRAKIPAIPAGNFGRPCREGLRASREQFRRRRWPSEQVGAPACFTCSICYFLFFRSILGRPSAAKTRTSPDNPHLFNGLILSPPTSLPLRNPQNNKSRTGT